MPLDSGRRPPGAAPASLLIGALLCGLLSGGFAGRGLAAPAAGELPPVVPGEILVRFRPDAPLEFQFRSLAARRAGGDPAAGPATDPLPGPAGLRDLRPAFPAAADARAGWPDGTTPLGRTWRLTISPGADAEAAAREWSRRDDVELAAPIRLIPLLTSPPFEPNDPALPEQWQHAAIASPEGWWWPGGDSTVVIAIVDTGVDLTHDDLAANLWTNREEAVGLPGHDDDGNGYIDDVHGYDFTDVPEIAGAGDYRDRDGDPSDDVGHGTWVAGAAAAVGDNGVGGAGIAWRSRIMALRAGFRPGTGFSLGFLAEDDAAAAILYAVDNGADVINLSFGDFLHAPILEEAVRYAVDRGTIVVAAAGNSGDDTPFFPAGVAGVLAVGASDRDGRRAAFSTVGPTVRLLAPGASVPTTELGGGVAPKSGTSLAAPVAAGALAVLRALHPDWPASRLIETLMAASVPANGAAAGGRLLRLDRAIADPGDAVLRLDGLDDDGAFDDTLAVHGTVAGGGVRGWRVLVRAEAAASWTTIAVETRGVAIDRDLVAWPCAGEPEGDYRVRVEALGLDQVVAAREVRVRIDHTAPVISEFEILPVLSGEGYGLRVSARADEPVIGRATVRKYFVIDGSGDLLGPSRFESALAVTDPVLGVDGPLSPGHWRVETAFVNRAGLVTATAQLVEIPEEERVRERRDGAPDASTWLPGIVDLDGDGRAELVGESTDRTGHLYGEVRAWRRDLSAVGCPGDPPFEPAWASGDRFIPRDFGDFDGDGRGDLLGQALQEVRVYSPGPGGGFPDRLSWSSTEAWGARFIPAPDGAGLDIVASRDNAIRIYRRGAAGLELRQELVNTSPGFNGITPAIERVRTPEPGSVVLATIDSDGDLLIAARGHDGLFAWRQVIRLGPAYLPLLAAVDLAGDGSSELAVVEAVGEVPSPSVGLRDGFYRLQLIGVDESGAYAPRAETGAAGQFPGNPVHLQAAPRSDGSGGEWLWWTVNGRAYQMPGPGGALTVRQVVDGVGDGPMASFRCAGGDDPCEPYTVLPAVPGGGGGPDCAATLIRGPVTGPDAAGAIRNLSAERLERPEGSFAIRIGWAADPDLELRLSRTRLDQLEPPVVSGPYVVPVSGAVDSTLAPGGRYRYTLSGDGAEAELIVTAEAGNPITSRSWVDRRIVIEWQDPIRATGSARLLLDPPVEIVTALVDRSGRRLVATTAANAEVGRTYRLRLVDYRSESNLLLSGADADVTFDVTPPGESYHLVSLRAADARTILVELAPAASPTPLVSDFVVEEGPAISGAEWLDERTVRLRLAGPLPGGSVRVRLSADARGPGGLLVVPGEGDLLPLRLDPVAYPNPVRPGHESVRIDWLAPGADVRIVDLSGRETWVGVAGPEGWCDWPVTGVDGGRVAPGIYLVRISGDFEQTIKLGVIN